MPYHTVLAKSRDGHEATALLHQAIALLERAVPSDPKPSIGKVLKTSLE